MEGPRKQPNGKWQGIAVHPDGRRRSKVFALKKHAEGWARDLETSWAAGGGQAAFADKVTVGEWITEWRSARRVDPVTADKEASHIRNHILPKWERWPMHTVRRMDVSAWVKEMEDAGVGPHTIVGVVSLFGTICKVAVEEDRITRNPAARIKLAPPPPKTPFFWTRMQAAVIMTELPAPWRTACDLCFHVGLRPGEMLGLHVRNVDWERGLIHVRDVLTTRGLRAHPKSSRSQRTVPIPPHLMDDLGALVLGRDPSELVFTGARGKPTSLGNFRTRFFDRAVALAGACDRHRYEGDRVEGCRGCKLTRQPGRPCPGHRTAVAAASPDCEDCTPVPAGTPHEMRHTAASWLVQDGVDLYRVQELLGHESFRTTQRYAHLAPDSHDRIKAAWRSWTTED